MSLCPECGKGSLACLGHGTVKMLAETMKQEGERVLSSTDRATTRSVRLARNVVPLAEAVLDAWDVMADVADGWVCGVIAFEDKGCSCSGHSAHLAARWLYRQGCAPGVLE